MDRKRGRSMQEEAKAELNRRGLWGYVEPVLTMGSAAFAEPVSGLVGLAALPYGVDAAARAIANTQEALTYQPRTEDGQQGLQDAAEFMQPVGDAFIGASEYLGDAAYDATGSPALGAAAYSVPTMALEALGLKGVKAASKGRAAYEMADIGSQASQYGGRQRGAVGGITQIDAIRELEARGVPKGSYLDENWQQRMLTKERFDELGLGDADFGTTRADLTKAHPDGISYLGGAKFDTPVPAEGGPAYSDMFDLGWAVKKPSAAKGLTRDDYLIPTAMFPDSHKSNATVSTVYTKALDEHINNGWIADRTIAEMELDLAKQFPDVPQGGNPKEFDKWLRSVSFDKRAAVMTTLNKAKFEGKGLPDINRLLNHTIDSGAAGREAGEAMTLIANSPDKTPVKLGSDGHPAHLSYDYGTKGKVEAVMPPALMEADLFPEKYNQYFDSFKERGRPNPKADTHYTFRIGSHGNRFGESIRELLPSKADIEGKRQVNTKSFKAALATLNDDWSVIQQGSVKGVKEFLRSMEANEGGATLTQLNAKGLAADIKQGKAKIFQLGSGSRTQDMKFMIKRDSYKWADESLPDDEWVLSSVLNNEVGIKGVAAEAILHKAMKEGVTALDAFDVKGAYGLPQIYSKYGFEEAARLPFDKEMFLGDARQFYIDQNLGNNKRVSPRLKKEADAAANQRLADAENFWRSQGWDESQGYPDVVIMRQDYNDANIAATDQLYKRAAQRARDAASGRAIGSGSAQSSTEQQGIFSGVLNSAQSPQGGRGASNSAFSDSDGILPSGRRSGVIDTVESGLAYPTLRRTLE